MKKTDRARLLSFIIPLSLCLIVSVVCYCKIFHNLTHKVNNPYLLDKNWMIALTVGLLGFSLAIIIGAIIETMAEPETAIVGENLQDKESKTTCSVSLSKRKEERMMD